MNITKNIGLLLLCLLVVTKSSSAHGNNTISNIEFVENKGQWHGGFLYKAITAGTDVYLEKNGFTFLVGANDNLLKIHELKEGKVKEITPLKYHAYKVHFLGANDNALVIAAKPQTKYYNYYLGNDTSKWKAGLHPYYNVDYKNIYEGIDMHISSEGGKMKYDLILAPGANANNIKLQYEGTLGLSVKKGNLQVKTSVGTIEELEPYAYQFIDGEKKIVTCYYNVENDLVSFYFPEGYNKDYQLVIDPTINFATFTGSTADNWGFTATYDDQGNLYGGGGAAGVGYPNTTGSIYAGGGNGGGGNAFPSDIAITKFSVNGTILYSTYIGGADNDQPHSMIVDPSGNLIIAGRTYSANFPTSATGYDKTFNASNMADMVVVKLNATGNVIASTYIGGEGDDGVNFSAIWATMGSTKHNYGDDARSEIITDKTGNVYIASCTQSPTIPGFTGALSGTQDGMIFKLNGSLSTLTFGKYISSAGDDAAYVLALNKAETQLFVAGGTSGNIAGMISAGTVGPGNNGGIDGFIIKYDNTGVYNLIVGTYIGSNAYDQVYGIQIDYDDDVYVMGQTLAGAGGMPVIGTVYSNAASPQFIAKLNPNLTAYTFRTRFGVSNAAQVNISPVAFLVDTCENIYLSGWGGTNLGNGGTTTGMPTLFPANNPTTPAGILSATTDGSDFYFIVLSKDAGSLLYAAFYGDPGNAEHVDGGTSRFDKYGVIYQAICGACGTNPSNLPITPGAIPDGNTNCNLAAIKIQFNLGEVQADFKALPDSNFCLGEATNFINNSSNAASYEWDFGDGSPPNNQFTPSHTYSSIGTFTIRLIATNAVACKDKDTAYRKVVVDTGRIVPNFELVKSASCDTFLISLQNTSVLSNKPGAAGRTKYTWVFGDGSSSNDINPAPHLYPDTGTYTVTLIMEDELACNSPDSVKKTVQFSTEYVRANFELENLCERTELPFINNSKFGVSYIWYFGDGDTSHYVSPIHSYDTAGDYIVKLIAINEATCNKLDSITKTLTIKPSPTARFVHQPIIPETNVPTTFTNQSTNALRYTWNFGDNSGSEEVNPIHMYKRTGKYTTCLVAVNIEGCTDTFCTPVEADVLPLVDLPTGFTPNGDGVNDILYIRGAAIESASLKIYDRWGEKVFEVTNVQANDPKYGWDGTYKKKTTDIESFAFIMSGTFIDGTTFYRKGNVTLLR